MMALNKKNKTVGLYVQPDILDPLRWMLKEFCKQAVVRQVDSTERLWDVVEYEEWDILLLDTGCIGESLVALVKELREKKASLNTVLFVSPSTPKDDVLTIIRSNLVKGVIVRPFTGEIVSRYVNSLCGHRELANQEI